MKNELAGALAILLSVSIGVGCGGEDSKGSGLVADPGQPDVPYGPIGFAQLFIAGNEVGEVAFTAVAPKRSDMAHLFALPEPRGGGPGVESYYLSLVLERAQWRQGEYRGGVGGRVTFALSDGRSFAGDANRVNARATIDSLTAGEREYYLRGTMSLDVPSAEPGQEALAVKMAIN